MKVIKSDPIRKILDERSTPIANKQDAACK